MTTTPGLGLGSGPDGRRPVSYAHLARLSDDVGLFEHAEWLQPRHQHGYCVDDVARGLVVLARDDEDEGAHHRTQLESLTQTYLAFVVDAVDAQGRVHNRRVHGGGWVDRATVEDCWGRALWGLGTVVARRAELADAAYASFEQAAAHRSPDLHAMAFAAMGAAEILTIDPRHAAARGLLRDAARLVDTRVMLPNVPAQEWPWPEARLRYANAVLPETILAAGVLLEVDEWRARGLHQLGWLVDLETTGDPGARHRSVSPAHGWAPGERRPGFDQQPIEVAALADACARAGAVPDGETEEIEETEQTKHDWDAEVVCCEAWFRGDNDIGIPMADPVSGGGYDGLMTTGRNENQGAESTLSWLSTLQRANQVRARR